MLQSEMWIQKVLKACEALRYWWKHLLRLCFDNITEYDSDVVFDKNAIFLAFCSKCCFFSETMKKKTMLEARIKLIVLFESKGSDFILMYCMIRYSYNKIFWGPRNFSENQQKRWQGKS